MLTKKKRRLYQQRWRKGIGEEAYKKIVNASVKKYRSNPWVKTHQNINQRLKRSKDLLKWGNGYLCYVGILNYLTPQDLKKLWYRDNAASMLQPSIDREDSDGHYTVENCKYIEMKENRAKVRKLRTDEKIIKSI